MNAGPLDRLITIQRATSVKTATGEKTRTWSTLAAEVPANVQLPTTRQAMNGQQLVSEIDASFKVRYRTDITPHEDRRILYEGRTYRIKGVREAENRREALVIDCTSRAE